jgi:hypothetical protein
VVLATIFRVGFAITFTVVVATAVQELMAPVILYTVEAAGVATTTDPVEALKPEAGLQL